MKEGNSYISLKGLSQKLCIPPDVVTYYLDGLSRFPYLGDGIRVIRDDKSCIRQVHEEDISVLKDRIAESQQ